jgi:trans-2,3-dihydro-3-hydroxyanthranilate isomerase
MRYRYYTADVFTEHIFGGNPLAVLPNAAGLETRQMQLIAREFNFSETVFVFPPQDAAHTRRLRIFTPGAELPFAGHPTVGTAFVLASIGEIELTGATTRIVFEEGVGPVPVSIRAVEGKPVFTQLSAARLPEIGPPPPAPAELAALLSLDVSDLLSGANSPQAISCGLPFLFVPLRNRDAVRRARVSPETLERVLADYWTSQVYVFSRDPELDGSDVRARMFASELGIVEDPATGAAATALAGYLGARDDRRDGTLRWVVEQGFEMGRPSLLEVEADKTGGKITAIRVGGASVLVGEGTLEVPPADAIVV